MNSFVGIVLLGVLIGPTRAVLESANEMVDVKLTVEQSQLRPGETGTVLISFKPKKGISITTDPMFELTIDTLKQFFALGNTTFVKNTKGCLEPNRSVEQRLIVARETPPGVYCIRGTFLYYYCSDKEGWCSRFRQPVELSLTVQ